MSFDAFVADELFSALAPDAGESSRVPVSASVAPVSAPAAPKPASASTATAPVSDRASRRSKRPKKDTSAIRARIRDETRAAEAERRSILGLGSAAPDSSIAVDDRGYPVITDAQRVAAGYSAARQGDPSVAKALKGLSRDQLRGDLLDAAVEIPKNFLKGGFRGGKIDIIGYDGSNLLASDTERSIQKRLAAVEAQTGLGEEERKESQALALVNRITSLALAQRHGITAEDISLTPENQEEVSKYLSSEDSAMVLVEPFSIKAGILGGNEDCLVAIGPPDPITGQPGLLYGFFKEGTFTKAPSHAMAYRPFNRETDLNRDQTIAGDPVAQAVAEQQRRMRAGLPQPTLPSAPATSIPTSAEEAADRLSDLMAMRAADDARFGGSYLPPMDSSGGAMGGGAMGGGAMGGAMGGGEGESASDSDLVPQSSEKLLVNTPKGPILEIERTWRGETTKLIVGQMMISGTVEKKAIPFDNDEQREDAISQISQWLQEH